ncbi:hypothetical protein VQH23_02735 [Pararoseomonas sp. SCSIO 73927]|uniref:hypothetical protein n=1 Tax=Pararoseomonas sp. SCSIO 73927 TaxID=3114537 RepID=UPI0030CE777B
MAESRPSWLDDTPEGLDEILEELVACFNERDLSRALLRAVGLVLIQRIAPPDEVAARTAQWQERWRETVRLEQQPFHRQL